MFGMTDMGGGVFTTAMRSTPCAYTGDYMALHKHELTSALHERHEKQPNKQRQKQKDKHFSSVEEPQSEKRPIDKRRDERQCFSCTGLFGRKNVFNRLARLITLRKESKSVKRKAKKCRKYKLLRQMNSAIDGENNILANFTPMPTIVEETDAELDMTIHRLANKLSTSLETIDAEQRSSYSSSFSSTSASSSNDQEQLCFFNPFKKDFGAENNACVWKSQIFGMYERRICRYSDHTEFDELLSGSESDGYANEENGNIGWRIESCENLHQLRPLTMLQHFQQELGQCLPQIEQQQISVRRNQHGRIKRNKSFHL